MDQSNAKYGLHPNGSIDLDQVLNSKNERKTAARRRWAILARALKSPTGSEPSSPTDEFSVRRISSFMLLTTQQLPSIPFDVNERMDDYILEQAKKRSWYKYSMHVNNIEYCLIIGHRNRTFSAEDLMGFNNTGNICIWPSEETLCYYVGSNFDLFEGKTVLELGGGMSCMAGLMVAKYASAKHVLVTDGNKISVDNVKNCLYFNKFSCPIMAKVLKWEDVKNQKNGISYDVVLCADCLFFDDARKYLIETLWNTLSNNGLALVMAPRRGLTLTKFISQAREKGFHCNEIIKYNAVVWEKHEILLENDDYDEDIHYPILIEVTKTKADYWKSQSRKYCDFCKCWIADNKPSVEFHEKGRRHKNNVAKRINTIQRNSRKEERESQKTDQMLKQMESAALAAYRKDVENNADFSSVALNEKLKQDNLQLSDAKKVWHEAKSNEGHTYYWNVLTNESVWEPPKEGYLSLAEQRDAALLKTMVSGKTNTGHSKAFFDEKLRSQEIEKEAEEERARQFREKLKARKVEDLPPVVHAPIIPPGKTEPYGQWQRVTISETPLELDLPQLEPAYEVPVYEPEPTPQPKEFKEKTVESLGTGSTAFKKRKIGMGAKMNIRRRADD